MTAECVWALTEGHIGMENQALGLAEALGGNPTVKRLRPRTPWSHLPIWLWFDALRSPGPRGDPLLPPWPDILISCGKRAAPVAAAIRRASAGRAFVVHIQRPPLDRRRFDLVVAPAHDGLQGDNVFVTQAAVHRVTADKLAAAAERFASRLADLPRPLVAVLIGGSNRRHRLTPKITADVAAKLAALCQETGAGLAVTPSRRTGSDNEAILRRCLADVPADIWDGNGENPYFGYLALADAIVVTCDSVSMASEACATGKPLYVIQLEGRSRRIDSFHAELRRAGISRPFDGRLATWSYEPPDDTARAAAEIRRRMTAR